MSDLTVTSETSSADFLQMVGERPKSSPMRRARLKRIGERVDELVKAKVYDEADRESFRTMCRLNIPLIEIEYLLAMAEREK